MKFEPEIKLLLASREPSIRYKVLVNVLGEDPGSKKILKLRQEIRRGVLVRALFREMDAAGGFKSYACVYDNWQGAHWILAALSDIGYPQRDKSLGPARDAILAYWLAPRYYAEFEARNKADVYKQDAIPVMRGRHRTHASQQGYALFFLIKLGLADSRIHSLVERLLHWQWPDGGWNCDKNPQASKSSFIHTALSLRGLAAYAESHGELNAPKAVVRSVKTALKDAAEVLLKRKLFKRVSNGAIISKEYTSLHYPLYWHYDILGGLKIMAEAGFIHDPRCGEALDLLLGKHLPDHGWPAESKYYRASNKLALGNDHFDWGGAAKKRMNEWVTADALYVLGKAGAL